MSRDQTDKAPDKAPDGAGKTTPGEPTSPKVGAADPAPITATNDDVSVTWTLARDGDALALGYELTNKTDREILVVDRVIAHHGGKTKLVPERVIVHGGSADGVVRFTRGFVDIDESHEMPHAPGVSRVAAGAVHRGSARIKLPLKGWHNVSTPPAIPDAPTAAELAIAYVVFDGEVPKIPTVETSEGDRVELVPLNLYNTKSRTIVTPPRALP